MINLVVEKDARKDCSIVVFYFYFSFDVVVLTSIHASLTLALTVH